MRGVLAAPLWVDGVPERYSSVGQALQLALVLHLWPLTPTQPGALQIDLCSPVSLEL